MPTTDVLMITYQRPEYTRLALERLLERSGPASLRVWIWHNGGHAPTLEVVRSLAGHPSVQAFHHSHENRGLRAPTNWLWESATGDYLAKVDDDCLVLGDWPLRLLAAHRDCEVFGVLGAWEFPDEDFDPLLAGPKIRAFSGGQRLLQNLWVGGSGYLMKRRCFDELGPLRPGQSFPQYQINLAQRGWVHGWPYPFVRQEHMDDPRSSYCMLRSDQDLLLGRGLSASANGCSTLAEWTETIRRSARLVQTAPLELRYYRGWRRWLRAGQRRIARHFGNRRQW